VDTLVNLKNIQAILPDFLNWLGIFIGATAIILSIVLYLKTKPLKLLAYANRMFMVLTDRSMKIEGLEVTVHGLTTPVITVNRIVLWNAGNQTISSEDLSNNDPIIIGPPHNTDVFEIAILEQTRIVNQANLIDVTNKPNFRKIKFDYLDPGDGILIHAVHNGGANEEFGITGSIKGGCVEKRGSYPEIAIANPKVASIAAIEAVSGGELVTRKGSYLALNFVSLLLSIGFLLKFLGKDGMSFDLITSLSFLLAGGMFFILAGKYSSTPNLKKFDDPL
jgi:hypothetical protein